MRRWRIRNISNFFMGTALIWNNPGLEKQIHYIMNFLKLLRIGVQWPGGFCPQCWGYGVAEFICGRVGRKGQDCYYGTRDVSLLAMCFMLCQIGFLFLLAVLITYQESLCFKATCHPSPLKTFSKLQKKINFRRRIEDDRLLWKPRGLSISNFILPNFITYLVISTCPS